jgi:hypothetical protein
VKVKSTLKTSEFKTTLETSVPHLKVYDPLETGFIDMSVLSEFFKKAGYGELTEDDAKIISASLHSFRVQFFFTRFECSLSSLVLSVVLL